MAASWKTLRVFISSTFRDMQAERDHLVRFVFPKLREKLLRRRIHLIDVDLRWGVTSDQDAVSICREVIEECHPRFMGMLGGRYGWIPEGQEHSITADEVRYGVLERDAELQGNAFFYFRDEEVTARMVEQTPGDFRESEGSENARKLIALKQAIVNAGLPAFTYWAHWDVQQMRLTGLEAFGEHVYAYLLKNIQDDPELSNHFASNTAGPMDEFAEEREAMEAFVEDRTERYVVGSRQALLETMTAFAATNNSEQNVLVIEGEPGSGKSSLLGKLCQLLASRRLGVLIPHFVGASVGSTDLRRTLRRLCYELAIVSNKMDVLPEDIRELIDLFGKLLAEAAVRQRIILVIDAINQFDAADGAHYMNWLPLALPPNICVIASSLEHPALAALRERVESVRIEKLEPLSETDARAIVDAFLQRYSKRLSSEQIGALLAKPESRLPLYLLTALQELRTLGTYEEISDRIRELPGEAKALFTWILKQRLSNDPGFRDISGQLCGGELVTKFVSFLGVSRYGLSQEELIGLIDPGDPLGNVAALFRLLRPYLMHRGELIDFFHNQLREAVENDFLNATDNRRQAHQNLARYFHNVADPNRAGRWNGTSVHAFSELVYHQIRAGASSETGKKVRRSSDGDRWAYQFVRATEPWPDLFPTLKNIFFLETKVAYGMAFDLASDFSDALAHLPSDHPELRNLKLMEEAIRRDVYFIAQHAQDYPQALFQCLWNSCWWYDCDEAAFHYQAPEGGWKQKPPWEIQEKTLKLSTLLERWRAEREARYPAAFWLRSMRPPLMQLNTGLLSVFRGHEDSISSVAFSPNGLQIISGSNDKTIRLWDAVTDRELKILSGHESTVNCVAFSPDGRRILSGSSDRTLRLWDAASGRKLFVLQGHKALVYCAAFSPGGRNIASGSWDNTVRLWDVDSGRELGVLAGHEKSVFCVSFSPDGQRVLTISEDTTLRVWDLKTGRNSAIQLDLKNFVRGAAFSPDGRKVMSGCSDFGLKLWDVESGRELARFDGHENKITDIAFSPNGKRVISSSEDMTIRLWDMDSLRCLSILRGHTDKITTIGFSRDGRRIISGSRDNTVRLWSSDEAVQFSLRGSAKGTGSVVFSSDGLRLVNEGESLQLWDTVSGRNIRGLEGSSLMDFSLDGRLMLTLDGDGLYRIRDANNGEERVTLNGWQARRRYAALFSPDCRRVVTDTGEHELRLFNAENGTEIGILRTGWNFGCWAFSPDGSRFASGGKYGETIKIWETNSGRELANLQGHIGWIQCVAFSPDNRLVLSGARDDDRRKDATARLWNAETGRQINIFKGHENGVACVAFSPDSRRVVTGGEFDHAIRIWDSQTGEELKVLSGHAHGLRKVAFSQDGKRITSQDTTTETRLWDSTTGECFGFIPGCSMAVADSPANSGFWQVSSERNETVIRPRADAEIVAIFPETFKRFALPLSNRVFAGFTRRSDEMVLLKLEGGIGTKESLTTNRSHSFLGIDDPSPRALSRDNKKKGALAEPKENPRPVRPSKEAPSPETKSREDKFHESPTSREVVGNPSEICFFCEKVPGDESSAVEMVLYDVARRKRRRNRQTVGSKTVKIPQCQRCARVKAVLPFAAVGSLVSALVVGIYPVIVLPSQRFGILGAVSGLVLDAILACLVYLAVTLVIIPRFFPEYGREERDYHLVQDLMAKGWTP